jgi:CRP-like cAMP-binding protein
MSYVTQMLAGVDLFAGLDEGTLERVASTGAAITFRAGDAIVEQGKSDRSMYVLLEGEATVEVNGERVGSLSSGAYLGETALIDNAPRSATVRAGASGAKAFAISALSFAPLLRDPDVAAALLVALTRRVRRLEEQSGAVTS